MFFGYSRATGTLKELADGLLRGLIRLAEADDCRILRFIHRLSICKVQRMQSHPKIAHGTMNKSQTTSTDGFTAWNGAGTS